MRRTPLLRLLALPILLGMNGVSAAPPTAIVANGFGTTVQGPVAGTTNITGGTTAGSNLFHSFSTFNLGTGNTADFVVSGNVANIVARVTGGPSSIDGTITSTLGIGGPLSSANLFLLNPAGVMFTANAQVNLGGSFIVGTADKIEFSDGTTFFGDVNHPTQDAGLTAAPVSAFGFLSATPQPISFAGSQVNLRAGTGIHVIGGDLSLDGASLLAPGGNLTFFSAASSGEVPFSLASPGTGYAHATMAKFGTINLTHGAQAEIDGNGGGSVVIRGGKITMDNSNVTSGDFGSGAGGDISVQADQLKVSNRGIIFTDTSTGAEAGSVLINVAGDLEVSGAGSQISADTESTGNGGDVTATVGGAVHLDGGNIFANVSTPGAFGHGGTVVLTAESMSMTGNSHLSSISDGQGDAGSVHLTLAGPLTMTDGAGILADTYNSGRGGDVIVAAPQISMTGTSMISADTAFGASGRAGDVTVQTGSLSIQGTAATPLGTLGITSESVGSSGDAGVIDVNADMLSLGGNATISSAGLFGPGNGGSVTITTRQGELSGASVIRASSTINNAGSVKITAADSLTISSGSSVSTSAGKNGGNITLIVGRLIYLNDSNIQAFAGVGGNTPGLSGGNIFIDPQFVALNNSFISANDLSPGGKDGNIVNVTDFFFSSNSQLFATGTINTTSPDLDLAQSLAFLPANLVDAQSRLRERCATAANHEFSTFIVVGRGGTESAPEEFQPDFGFQQF